MNNDRFDTITRQFSERATRRVTLRWLSGGVLTALVALGSGSDVVAQRRRVTICHFPGRARPGVVTSVPRRALRTHLQHGDFKITERPGRTKAACRSTCKSGKPACGRECCHGGETCERRNAFRPASVCCPGNRVFVECPTFHICPDDPLACCAPPGEAHPFCCSEELTCGATCCYEGERCLDPNTSLCTCPEAQQCGPSCCWPGLACLDPSTGECEEEVGFARLRRP